MLPLIIEKGDLPFKNLDYIFLPDIRKEVEDKADTIKAVAVSGDQTKEFTMTLGDLTDHERQIILDGCLINFNRQ
jgi:aconitate hydratase